MASLAVVALALAGCSKSKTSSETDVEEDEYTVSTYSEGDDSSSGSYSSGSYSDGSSSVDVSGVSSEDDSDEASDGNNDWDSWLNSYDEFATKYITLLNKVQKGDPSAIADYVEYAEKAQSFADKMSSASGALSASQLAKFNRIQQKILKAASSVKIDPSRLDAAANALEAVGNAVSNYGDDDDDDDDW